VPEVQEASIIASSLAATGRGEEEHFWQYNTSPDECRLPPSAIIESSLVWDISGIIYEPYANKAH